jgi:hypothetical protein
MRQNAYRCLFDDEIDDNDLENIRKAIQFSEPLGTDWFKRQLGNTQISGQPETESDDTAPSCH